MEREIAKISDCQFRQVTDCCKHSLPHKKYQTWVTERLITVLKWEKKILSISDPKFFAGIFKFFIPELYVKDDVDYRGYHYIVALDEKHLAEIKKEYREQIWDDCKYDE